MKVQNIAIVLMSIALTAVFARPAYSFDIKDFPVHQEITRSAIIEVNRSLNLSMEPEAINDIEIGNVHTDDFPGPHKKAPDQADLHFNNGHALTDNGREQFDRSFSSVRNLITRAAQLSKNNPRVLSPKYPTITQIRDRVISLCKEDEYKNHCRVTRIPILKLNYSHDPHVKKAERLLNLREELKPLLRAMRKNNDRRETRVRNIILEINAYEARQLLGHAFHAQQDFFSHSNFIELVNGKAGPPCAQRFGSDERCGTPVTGLPQRFGDPVLGPVFATMADGFQFFRSVISDAISDRTLRPFQTGFVKLNVNFLGSNRHVFCQPEIVPAEFDYCHWRGNQHPELNKDKPGNEDESHENHDYAIATAQFVSEMMWLSYLREADMYPKPQLRWQPRLIEGTVNVSQTGRYQILPDRQLRLTIPNPLALDSKFSYRIENSAGANAAQGGSRCSNGVDFVERLGQGVFRRGATYATIPVTLCPDSEVEVGGENFLVKIRSSSLEETSQVILIRDDDRHPKPILSSIGTAQGPLVTPGTSMLVTGRNFRSISRIEFDGRQIRPHFAGTKLLTFSIPRTTKPGTYEVSVTTATGGRSAAKRLGVAGPSILNKPELSSKLQKPKLEIPKLSRELPPPRKLPTQNPAPKSSRQYDK